MRSAVTLADGAVAVHATPPDAFEPHRSRLRGADLITQDIGLTITVALALFASAASAAFFFHAGLTTNYWDSGARLLIARTVLDGRHPGLAQLGGVWPPFPQVYMLPFAWNDFLYYTGLAGVIPSALSYVVASAFLYKLVARLTRDRIAGVIGVVAFSGPNVLYLQSVPMSELPFMACFVASVYYTVSWMLEGKLRELFLAAFAVCISTLTRYEGWVLAVLLTAAILYVCWRGGRGYHETEGLLVFFGLVAFLGMGLWLVWNQVIFGDALYFLHSNYGTKAVNSSQIRALPEAARTVGNLRQSVAVSGWLVLDNVGLLTACVAYVGLAKLVWTGRFGPEAIAGLLLLFPIAFCVFAAYTGAEVIVDPHATPGLGPMNLRYGLLLAPAAAFFVGCTSQGRWARWPVLAACLISSWLVWHAGILNIEDRTTVWSAQARQTMLVGQWLHANYQGGLVLIERPNHEYLLRSSYIALNQVVHEGDRSEWTGDLADPSRQIEWVVMDAGQPSGGTPPDDVWKRLHDKRQLTDHYRLVYQQGSIQVYRSKGT